MTFRPSDDVIDNLEQWNPSTAIWSNLDSITNIDVSNDLGQSNWARIFSNPDSENNWSVVENNVVQDAKLEEVKAPDLSELLGEDEANSISDWGKVWGETNDNEDYTVDLSELWNNKESDSLNDADTTKNEGEGVVVEWWKNGLEENIDLGKMSDEERSGIISWIEWSIHSKLDFLVDDEWKRVVETYKNIYRIIFRWWVFIFVTILAVLSWVLIQVKANQPDALNLVGKPSIKNINKRSNSNVDKILSNPIAENRNIEPIISYGSVSFNDKSFQSKSNLVKYRWIVLPQLAFVDFYSDDFISLEDFANKKTSREDVENMVKSLITDNLIYTKTVNLSSPQDLKWEPQTMEWWLIDWFELWCVTSAKLSDFVCDKFLEIFYEYWKYYDLSRYSSDLLTLVRRLSEQGKDIQPICTMVQDYVWHTWVTSFDVLGSVMNYCPEEDRRYYRKMVDYIEIENSLRQPELLDKVFDDPDLNAYKLISAQQIVYKSLKNASVNESFIRTYLNFVQKLIDKDKWSGRYLHPIYKDILYVFNTDKLYETLMQNGKLSSEIKSQIDRINKGDKFLAYEPLMSQLTTPNIVKSWWNYTGAGQTQITLEDVFSKYYMMNDRLKIRTGSILSDMDMKVQTEIYSDTVFKVTWWASLKATVLLHRKQNVLYVTSINIANQQDFSDTLNMYADDWNISFDDMLWYIDEQVWFWYKAPWEGVEHELTICDRVEGIRDVELYSCDESSLILYKWEVEYAFTLLNGVLESFTISDPNIDSALKWLFSSIMTSKENTPTIIESIVNYELDVSDQGNIEKKIAVIDQFRIHFKLVPVVSDIEWEEDVFKVEFSIWDDFQLEARYNVETHLLTEISYVACDKTLEIRNLTIEISSNNDSQLMEILNNPRMFFANANPAAYRKYQRMCE